MRTNFQATTWFITGATGLVGSAVVKKLKQEDFGVIALVRATSPKSMINWLKEQNVKIVMGDLLDPKSYENYIAISDVVVNAAAVLTSKDEENTRKTNVEGTRLLCEVMTKYGCKRLIQISSCGVYGKTTNNLIKETDETRPIGYYSESKLQSENILKKFNDISFTVIRPPFIIGKPKFDRRTTSYLVNMFNRRIIVKSSFRDPKMGFVHVEDLSDTIVHLGCLPSSLHTTYNIQSFDVKYSELNEIVTRITNRKNITLSIPYLVIFIGLTIFDKVRGLRGRNNYSVRDRSFRLKYNWIFDVSRLVEEFTWSPKYPNPNVLETYIMKYLRNNNLVEENKDIRN